MKTEYDFSKGERGKFFKSDVELRLPIYLAERVAPKDIPPRKGRATAENYRSLTVAAR